MKKLFSAFIAIFLVSIITAQDGDVKRFTQRVGFISHFYQTQTSPTIEIYEKYAHDYLNDTYTRYKDNEFVWHDKLQLIKSDLDKDISQFDQSSAFSIITVFSLGEYDFTENGFSMRGLSKKYFPLSANKKPYSALGNANLMLLNSNEFPLLPFQKDDARKFIEKRTDAKKNVNRDVDMTIKFKLVPIDSEEYVNYFKEIPMKSTEYYSLGKIYEIIVFDPIEKKEIGRLKGK